MGKNGTGRTMKTQSADTPPDIEEMVLERYRQMTPQEKIAILQGLNWTAMQMALAGIRMRHGSDLPEREQQIRLAALWLDRETMIKVYGWDPEVEGY
jgi:hypothetical protein